MSTSQELPIDLVFDIISRLEVKDVLRCSVVSKPIYSMIKTPSFVYKHLQHSEKKAVATGTNIIAVSPKSMESGRDTIVHFLFSESKVVVRPPVDGALRLLASCNGLLFLILEPLMNLLLLWNPATKKYRILPTPYFNFATFGFGYDAGSGCYKVVKISSYFCKKPYLAEVWSTITNRWTEIKDTILPKLLQRYYLAWYHAGCFVKGHLYWLGTLRDGRGPYILVSFALGNDSFRQVMLPDAYAFAAGSLEFSIYIGEVMGSIALFCRPFNYDDKTRKSMHDIWVMEDNDGKDSWSKMASIGPFPWGVRSTSVFIDGKFLMKNSGYCSGFFLYDSCTKEETALLFKAEIGGRIWSWSESLVSVTEHGDNHEYTDSIDLVDTELSDAIKRNLNDEE